MRACDVCRNDDKVEEIGLGPFNDPAAGLQVARDVEPIAKAELCEACRSSIKGRGLVEGLLSRYASSLPRNKRGTALSQLLR